MLKLIVRSSAFLMAASAAIAPIAPAVAQNDGGVMYERYYYDDAAMTIQVGYEQDTCNRFGVGGGRTEGRYGPYVQTNAIAYCIGGNIQPI